MANRQIVYLQLCRLLFFSTTILSTLLFFFIKSRGQDFLEKKDKIIERFKGKIALAVCRFIIEFEIFYIRGLSEKSVDTLSTTKQEQ